MQQRRTADAADTADTADTSLVLLATALRRGVSGFGFIFLVYFLFRHSLKNTANSYHALGEPKKKKIPNLRWWGEKKKSLISLKLHKTC
jgi:hypothetical protein